MSKNPEGSHRLWASTETPAIALLSLAVMYDMTELLTLVVTERAEGVSVTPGQAPAIHLKGEIHRIEGPEVSPEHASSLLRTIAGTRQMRELQEHSRADFLFTFRESRFRVAARTEHGEVHFHIHATG